jgi:hypothetical protein
VAIVFNWVVVNDGRGDAMVLRTYLHERLFAPWLSPSDAWLAYALAYVVIWLGLLTPLYRRRIFIRICARRAWAPGIVATIVVVAALALARAPADAQCGKSHPAASGPWSRSA